MPEPRLDDPILWRSNLTANHTRFDYPRASASPDNLHIQFSLLGALNLLVALACGLLILSILTSKKLRSRPFDLYLLFIAIPDFISGFSCMLTCLLSAEQKQYYSEAMCAYQSFYLDASVSANAWLNVVITYQIHRLLRYSHQRRRYIPPTRCQVCGHAALVYAYSIFWGALSASQGDILGMPFPSHAYGGFYCLPMEQPGNSWFFYLVFLNGVFLLPGLVAIGFMIHILYKGLLPQQGKRRQIAIFLMRVICLYLIVFLPVAVSVLIGNFVMFDTDWGYYVPAVLTHFQGIFTTLLCYLTSEEIKRSMNRIMTCNHCCCGKHRQTNDQYNSSEFYSSSSWLSSWFSLGNKSRQFGSDRELTWATNGTSKASRFSSARHLVEDHEQGQHDENDNDDDDAFAILLRRSSRLNQEQVLAAIQGLEDDDDNEEVEEEEEDAEKEEQIHGEPVVDIESIAYGGATVDDRDDEPIIDVDQEHAQPTTTTSLD